MTSLFLFEFLVSVLAAVLLLEAHFKLVIVLLFLRAGWYAWKWIVGGPRCNHWLAKPPGGQCVLEFGHAGAHRWPEG